MFLYNSIPPKIIDSYLNNGNGAVTSNIEVSKFFFSKICLKSSQVRFLTRCENFNKIFF